MSIPSPTLLALRAATAAAHARLERDLHIAAPHAGRDAFARHAAAFWGWLEPFEDDLWRGWPAGVEPDARAVKSGWLADDIARARADGYLAQAVPRRSATPFTSLAERAGCAYVIEGSMLGAQVLLRRLQPSLAPWPARWLQGYGEHGARRWREFIAGLEECVRSPREREVACASAVHAFETLDAWFRERGVAGAPVIFSRAENFRARDESAAAGLR
jgi:heme oxygenase